MKNNLLKIWSKFKKFQTDKIYEEFGELTEAFCCWVVNPSKENFIELIDELNDFTILALQFAIGKYDMSLEEIESMKQNKIYRTVKIINQMDPSKDSVEEYNRIRRA